MRPACVSARPRIVVGGFLGLLPAGGITWDYIQYPVGFAALGCDVFYIEDTRLWPIYQANEAGKGDCSANVTHLGRVMADFGLSDRWSYRDEVSGLWFGLTEPQVRDICRTADVFVNISCSTYMRDEYRRIPVRVLIDSDPMFTQIQCVTGTALAGGKSVLRELVDAHSHHFTFGQNVHAATCPVPKCGIQWRPTRQPICLPYWRVTDLPTRQDTAYTTVMNWSAAAPLQYDGQTWGQKNVEFARLMTVPKDVPDVRLAVAVGQTTGDPFPCEAAKSSGWTVLDPDECVPDWRCYRHFIEQSRGELSIAKETYVKARTGWFSCRSACYLAAGRPVVTQDTGWTDYLPSGTGLLAFRTQDEAVQALKQVEADPKMHARAARQIAEEHFDSNRVLGDLLEQLGV